MSGEWATTSLAELCHPERSITYGIVQPGSETDDGVPIVRVNNFAEGGIDLNDLKRVSPNIEAEYERSRLRGGELLVTLVGSIGQAAIAPNATIGFNVARAVGVIPISNPLNAQWAFYMITSIEAQKFILSRANTTVQATFNLKDLSALKIPFPPEATRYAIVQLLSALDDKIALNRRKAGTLEGIARALFQSWFVDFDPVRRAIAGQDPGLPASLAAMFPATLTHDGLPEGWTMEHVGDVFDIVAGNTPSTEQARFWGGTHAWATPKDLSKLNAPILLTPERALTDEGLRACSSGLLPAGTLFLSSRAPIGYLAFVNQPTAINQGIAAFRRKNVSTSFAWAWCQANMALIVASANGSTFLEISKGVLRQLPMVQAPEAIIRAFAEIADPLVDRIVALVQQNTTLAALRDTLLPKLISGELRVSDAETIAAGV